MVSRRKLLAAGAAGTAVALVRPGPVHAAPHGSGELDPRCIRKYVTDLVIPGIMPRLRGDADTDEYVVAVRQFRQQILPDRMPATTVWGYGSPHHRGSFGTPGATIEAQVGRRVRVTWTNELVDRHGRYLPHLFPVDPTLHWANPAGGSDGRDHTARFRRTPGAYRGPVPLVTHLHGGHTDEDSDGFPEAWYLPDARNLPADFAHAGTAYHEYRDRFADRCGLRWGAGGATFQYENEQRATALWYHDHTLGVTRLNMYAGTVGFYLLRGGADDLPDEVLPGNGRNGRYEIPLIIQDRSFKRDGSLAYPVRSSGGEGGDTPFIPDSDIPPLWVPGFHGNTIVVNGSTWPVLRVEPRRYRLRLLNACNGRFLLLSVTDHPTRRPARPAVPLWVIGSDGGFLSAPTQVDRLPLTNGERYDVVVDFTGMREGSELYLVNEGPDEHVAGGRPGRDYPSADPHTTGQVMKFEVCRLRGPDTSTEPHGLPLPAHTRLGAADAVRSLAMLEVKSAQVTGGGTVAHMLGTFSPHDGPRPRGWHDPVTERVADGSTEIWELRNLTGEAHPIHLHHVHFQLLGRGYDGQRPPESWETGWKDTVTALPGHITRIKAHFSGPGRYVWHCHVLEHEDNEMMLPYVIEARGNAGKPPTGPVNPGPEHARPAAG